MLTQPSCSPEGLHARPRVSRLRTTHVLLFLAAVFVATPSHAFLEKLRYQADAPMLFQESGRDLVFAGEPEGGDLFTWIRERTPPEAVFLDPTGLVPIYGQRGVLISPNVRRHLGFGGNP